MTIGKYVIIIFLLLNKSIFSELKYSQINLIKTGIIQNDISLLINAEESSKNEIEKFIEEAEIAIQNAEKALKKSVSIWDLAHFIYGSSLCGLTVKKIYQELQSSNLKLEDLFVNNLNFNQIKNIIISIILFWHGLNETRKVAKSNRKQNYYKALEIKRYLEDIYNNKT